MYQLRLSIYRREFIFSIHLKPSVSHLLTVVRLLEAEEGEQNRTDPVPLHTRR